MRGGRGILSDGRLAAFCRFFLAACIDQVRFMQKLLAPEALSRRVREFIATEAVGERVAFPLGQSERFFPHLWAPSDVATTVMPPEIEDALRAPWTTD